MIHQQLWQHLKDNGVSLDDASAETGYSLGYLLNLLKGNEPLNDRARFKFIRAYPETASFLLKKEPV